MKWIGNEHTSNDEEYVLKAGTRICQACHPSLTPFSVNIKNNLSNTVRGEKGFGSSGF